MRDKDIGADPRGRVILGVRTNLSPTFWRTSKLHIEERKLHMYIGMQIEQASTASFTGTAMKTGVIQGLTRINKSE